MSTPNMNFTTSEGLEAATSALLYTKIQICYVNLKCSSTYFDAVRGTVCLWIITSEGVIDTPFGEHIFLLLVTK